MATNHELFASTVSYTFKFFLATTSLDVDESLHAMFPMQYNLHLCDGNTEYTCDTSLVDNLGSTETWNSDTGCATSDNWVMLDPAVVNGAGYTLETTDTFMWTIDGVGNPESALARTAATTWDFDATDSDILGTLYAGWTNKFGLYSFDASDKTYTGRSYGNLNAAYVGFNYEFDNQFTVNSGNRVTVWAGSYSQDVAITVGGNSGSLASKKVTLSPSTNSRSRRNPDSNIAFQSLVENYVILSEVDEIHFRVGADINLGKGLYYIDWSITEESFTFAGVETANHYHAPAKTMVEVVAKVTGKYTFSVQNLVGNPVKGTTSPSIAVSVSNAPFTDVNVNLSLLGGDNVNLTFEPSVL